MTVADVEKLIADGADPTALYVRRQPEEKYLRADEVGIGIPF